MSWAATQLAASKPNAATLGARSLLQPVDVTSDGVFETSPTEPPTVVRVTITPVDSTNTPITATISDLAVDGCYKPRGKCLWVG